MGSKKQAWKQFSNEIEATYVKGGIIKSDRIEATFENWPVVYDTFVLPAGQVILVYTRIRAPFIAKSDFKFSISKKTFFSKIAQKLGKSNVTIDDSRIDEAFVIKSNSPEKIRQLLSDETLKSLLLEKTNSHFEFSHGYKGIGRQFPKGYDGLSMLVLYEGKDIDKLRIIYNLFGEVLTSLLEADEIEDAPVNVKL